MVRSGRAATGPASAADLETTDSVGDGVLVQCVKEGSKLRARVVADGFDPNWNMRFPRSVREDGTLLSASVPIVASTRGSPPIHQAYKAATTTVTTATASVIQRSRYRAAGRLRVANRVNWRRGFSGVPVNRSRARARLTESRSPSAVEPAVVLGLMRQESSFDAQAGSPAGARGLMQLMPATAAGVARRLGEPVSPAALTADPAYNMRLGTDYLRALLDRFGGVLPLALAGYNAGPSRVAEWLAAHGDPSLGGIDWIDWIELIPFSETRNYVQRVVENVVIYRARQGRLAPHPLAQWQQ